MATGKFNTDIVDFALEIGVADQPNVQIAELPFVVRFAEHDHIITVEEFNDGGELMDRLPNFLGKLHQSRSFLGCHRDACRQLTSEDLILDLQVFDLASQFFFACAGDYHDHVGKRLSVT